MKISQLLLFILLQVSFTSILHGQNIELAKDLYTHNLNDRSLEIFIEILHNPESSADHKAEALYYIGQISFENGHYTTALEDWKRLIDEYPSNSKADEIKDRLSQLREVFAEVSDASITSTIAQSYIKNGDFWSEASKRFTIDSSWMSNVELAMIWYDKVIAEFPDTDASEIAFQRKLFTILGWSESGRYASSYGIKEDYSKYMPMLLKTFEEFEIAHPESPYLQGFRYQIAQTYWGEEDWANTRNWLNKIIEKGNGQETFYTETAKTRLQKVEY